MLNSYQEVRSVPKPVKVEKVKKQWKPGQKKEKIVPEWKQGILSHHKSNPNKADRAEFPASVVTEAKMLSGGLCQYCKSAPCTQSHHSMPRNRSGRGVLSNLFRVCTECHMAIEASEEKKQEIIALYEMKFGQYFYFDEQDFNELALKQAKADEAENAKLMKDEQLEPIVELLTAAAGRKLKAKELRLLDGFGTGEMAIFAKLMSDIVQASIPTEPYKPEFGYGKFND